MKRFTLALVFAVVAIGGMTSSTKVSAQEILLEGPLAGAPAVRKLVEYRKMRFSIGPQFAYTILNPYMHNFLLGARMEFNFFDWMGVGLVGYYALNAPTKLTNHITDSRNLGGEPTTPADSGSNWPSYTGAAFYEDQVAKLKGQYLAQISFVPFRGKMSMFEKLFVAIDGSIFLGGGIVHYEERATCDGSQKADGTFESGCGDFNNYLQTKNISNLRPDTANRIGGAFTVGLGFMAYFNNWFALNIEFRMTPFKWNAAGTDESGQAAATWNYAQASDGSPTWQLESRGNGDYPNGQIGKEDRVWNLNMSIGLGFIFYLPTTPRIGS